MSSITPADEFAPESSELDELRELAPEAESVTFQTDAGIDVIDESDAVDATVDEDDADVDDDTDDDDTDDEIELEDDSDDEFEDDSDDSDDDESDDEPAVPFASLGLPEALTALLARDGVVDAFPIQAATIPDALAGKHVLGKARTGSGKTLAFGLPMLANLEGKRARKGKPLGLVLVPTRELAMQVSEALRPYGYAIGVDIAAVFGGAPMYKQVYALRRGVEVLVATPGRLTDLIEQEECSLDEVSIAVLDEADQMADMGFMPVVSELLSQTDPSGQRLLFSATLDGAVDELVQKYLTDPVLHSVASEETTPARMDHHLLVVEPTDKSTITAEIAARHTPGSEDTRRTILFARTKLGADRIAEKIREAGVAALALHGGMTQRARTRTLDDFKAGRVPVLVATDVAARGIHVDGIDLVLHVDPANDAKDYLHRAGRTARAGEAGTVVTLVLPKQRKSTLRLLEQAGVEAELTKVAPSSDVLRALTGGRPVAEYAAEAEAWRAARRAAREARFDERGDRGDRDHGGRFERGGDRRFGRDGRDGRDAHDRFDRERGDRAGRFDRPGRFEERGGERGTRFERDRAREQRFGDARGGFERGERSGFGGERSGSGFGGDRGNRGERSFDRGERSGFGGDRGERSGFGGNRGERSFDRGERSGFGGDRGERSGFGGDRGNRGERSFDRGERSGSGFGGDRGNRGERSFDRGERSGSGFGGDRGERSGFGGDRGNRGERSFDRGERSSSGFGGDRGGRGERSSFGGDRVPRQDRGFGDRGSRSNERSGFGSRGASDRDGFRGGDRGRDFGGRSDRPERSDRGTRGGYGDRDTRGGYGSRDGRGDTRNGFGGGSGGASGSGNGGGNRPDRRSSDGGERGPWREQRDRRDFGGDRAGASRGGDQRGAGSGAGGERGTFSRNGGERRGFGGSGGGSGSGGGGERRDERPGRDRRW